MPFKKGESGNPNGRPRGARNKFHADREIAKAVASGMDFTDIVELLTKRIEDPKVTDVQKTKYLSMLIDLKIKLSDREKKMIEENEKKEAEELARKQPITPQVTKKESTVEAFPVPKIKRS